MAFASGSNLYACFKCQESFKHFKMMESDDPFTHEDEEQPDGDPTPVRKKRHRVCPRCELEWRVSVQQERSMGIIDPEWATKPRVMKDMKLVNKGDQHFFRGVHFKAACFIVESGEHYHKLTKKGKMKAKTLKCKELASHLVQAIRANRLFEVFRAASQRFNISSAAHERLQIAFNVYLADPEDREKLRLLEQLEDEVHVLADYKTADGNVPILKALDYHNDLHPGFVSFQYSLNVFDICRSGVQLFMSRCASGSPIHSMPKCFLSI